MYFRPPPKGPEWGGGDAEAGLAARPLYPMMLESPQLRWAFIRKVYTILSIQMLLTVAVASVVVFVRPVALFFVSSPGGFGLYIFIIILPFIGTYAREPKSIHCWFRLCGPVPNAILLCFLGCDSDAQQSCVLVLICSAVSSVLLLPAPPGEPAAAWPLHGGHQLLRRPNLRLHQR